MPKLSTAQQLPDPSYQPPQALTSLFQNNELYHKHRQQYRKELKSNSYPTMLNLLRTVQYMLSDQQYDPYSKLLSLRFLRQVFLDGCVGYGFVTMLGAALVPVFKRIVKKCLQLSGKNLRESQKVNEQIGSQLFLGMYGGFGYQVQYLKKMGVSMYTIIIQMLQTLSQVFSSNPYSSLSTKIPSTFTQTLQQLSPPKQQQRWYYKPSDLQKIKKRVAQKYNPNHPQPSENSEMDSKEGAMSIEAEGESVGRGGSGGEGNGGSDVIQLEVQIRNFYRFMVGELEKEIADGDPGWVWSVLTGTVAAGDEQL